MEKELQEYSKGFIKRAALSASEQNRHRLAAWEECRSVVDILRQKKNTKRIILFGSLSRNDFEATSDLDLAVEGLPLSEYDSACREIEETARLPVNLIRFEDISAGFRKIVEESGVILYDRTGKESGSFKTPNG